MKKAVWTIIGLMAASLATANVMAAGSIEKGKAKSAMCIGCHGPNGQAGNPMWPNLAGQSAGYIVKQLSDFKSGARSEPMMALAAGLTKDDMENLAAYFSSLAPKKGAASNKALAQKGERLYRGGNAKTKVAACMACHGPSGQGISPNYPAVSGQNAAYAEKQLKAFKDGVRNNDNKVMTGVAFSMSLEEIKAVSEYMQGLQ